MRTNPTQRWWAIGAGLSVAVLATSWFLLIGPSRAEATELSEQVEQSSSRSELLQLKSAQLKAAFAKVPQQQAQLAAIKAQLPSAAEVPTVLRDLESYARTSGVELTSVTPGAPVLAADAATAGTPQNPSLVQLPLSIAIKGEYFEASLFLKSLQTSMSRAVLITGVQLTQDGGTPAGGTTPGATPAATPGATPAPGGGQVSLTITGRMFVLLDGSTDLAEVEKAAKAATG